MPIPNETNDIARVGETLYAGFKTVPVCEYLYKKMLSKPADAPSDTEGFKQSFVGHATFYKKIGGFLVEVNDFDAVSLWARPENDDSVDLSHVKDQKFIKEFVYDTEATKKKILGDIPTYHLFMVAKDLGRNTKGSVRSIFEHYTAQADREGAAIYLEAISEEAASVYEYFGFKRHSLIRFGEGEINEKGEPDKNGKGYTAFLMIYYSGELPCKTKL